MDAGIFKEQMQVLKLEKAGNSWDWSVSGTIWGKAEIQEKPALFSKTGVGANGIKFMIRKRDLTLKNALKWRGRHCFLTYLQEINRMYLSVSAALIEPQKCMVAHQSYGKDEFNRPTVSEQQTIFFPGILTEKYLRFSQEEPQGNTENTMVLITPKVITLASGEFVTVGETDYSVQICHDLDEYKNEYEIYRKRDV